MSAAPTSKLPRADLPKEGALPGEAHRFPIRVYYEDTDAAGIVYYANYLKFIERARTEMMRLYGVEHEKTRQSGGTAFIVRRCEIEYVAPARLDDELVVETRIKELGGATILLSQDVLRDGAMLVRTTVLVACIGVQGRPVRLPAELRSSLSSFNDKPRMVSAHAR
ncbi:MAG TPA: tol-pal system-associated acyl-CoA thioesterase [Stellaceae bacterium]|nr:tol-pal system-associated acyl-CoA thioesterase [Stellaceae bacterium]